MSELKPPSVTITVEKMENGTCVTHEFSNVKLPGMYPWHRCSVFRDHHPIEADSHVGEILAEFREITKPEKRPDDKTP